ncbi:MAG: hypothetical protein IJ438_09720 [Clostridia bacterium]|nr:hypothetical protein [Clostridia bacterium]
MKTKTIHLDGQWHMSWCDIGAGGPQQAGDVPTLPYMVPGDVHTPLVEAGLIQEPLYGTNSLDCRWVEEKEFWCRRTFALAESDIAPAMLLTFEGLDCTADVYLNGQHVGRHNNAFVEITWDVAKLIHPGENTLLVRIDQGLREAQTHDLEQMGIMWNNDQPWRSWMRKPQFVYGWDWTIWLASCGIWRDVTLTAVHHAAIEDVYARPATASLCEGMPCEVVVDVTMLLLDEAQSGPLSCIISDREGRNVAANHCHAEDGRQRFSMTIPEAHLWWCNGMGEPYLYTVTVSATDASGKVLDTCTQRMGLRTIRLTEPELPNDETGFTFVLNGEPVFCKGANHVPCDCLPGRITAEKEIQLVTLARDEHMNMLRVWGGGVYSSEAMMNACDEMGIMVWHDFMYACGYHPDHDPGFVKDITIEATKAIRRLRRHASLIGWAGNNEIQEMYHSQKQWKPDLPWYGGMIYEKILPFLVQEMCPTLVYRESSPFGGERQADCRHGDQHIWLLTHVNSHPHYMDLWRFTEFPTKFLSEFGLMGAMTMETAQSCIPAEHMRPDDPVWLHHTNSCQDHTLLARMERQYFGEEELSAQQFILRSQAIQAEITRHIYEEFRRQKFVCSGLLFWTLSDSYGVHNWSLIDYALRRKPIYHALKQAMAPLALCVKGWDVQNDEGRIHWREHWQKAPGTLEIWGMNDTLRLQQGQLEWTLMTLQGAVLQEGRQSVQLPENQSALLAEISLTQVLLEPENTILRARLLADGQVVNETRYFFAPFKEMIPRDAAIQYRCRPLAEGQYEVTLTADRFVWMLHLAEPEGTVCSDNDFDLWPNEPKTVIVTTDQKNFAPVLRWMGQTE